jgi:hypothetical protein
LSFGLCAAGFCPRHLNRYAFGFRKGIKMNKTIRHLVFLCCFLVIPNLGYACSCPGRPIDLSYDERIKAYKKAALIVFSGKVENVNLLGELLQEVKFKVDRIWKGTKSDEIVLYVEKDNGANCGITFSSGQSYLIFADAERNGRFGITGCSFLQFLDSAQPAIKVLESDKEPKAKRKARRPKSKKA